MNNIAYIPARGGSKRLPGKNIRELCGRPLILYTLDAALESGRYENIVVTSDSDEILDVCSGIDQRVRLHKRPTYLATDTATVLETVQCLCEEETKAGRSYDTVSLMLPTAPLRTARDINAAFELLTRDLDSVVSVTEFNFPPQLGLMIDADGLVQPYHPSDPFRQGRTRSQDYPKVFRPTGAIYLSWWKSFARYQNFFKGRVTSSYVPPAMSVDIDTELDTVIAAETIRYYGLPMSTE